MCTVVDSVPSVQTLGVICELKQDGDWRGFDLQEFADLDDGRRVVWKHDRGWTGGTFHEDCDWPLTNGRDLTVEAVMVTGDAEDGADSYVEHAFRALRDLGHSVTRSSVYFAPFRVEYGPVLEREPRSFVKRFDS